MNLDQILFYEGENHEEWYGSISPPIYQTSNFMLHSVEEFREKIKDEFSNHLYTRGNNPTVHILRKKLAALEGMEEAIVFSSGSAAMNAAIASQVSAGDHVLCVAQPYTWTRKFLDDWLSRFGVSCTYSDGSDTDVFLNSVQENTKCIVLESPNSLLFSLQDLSAISRFARERNICTVLDNSYCSPLYQRTSDFGIDLAVHSTTKYINGHGDVLGGVVCGSEERMRRIFANEYMMWGAICHPHEAALMLRGLRTLPLRLERSNASSLYIAEKLSHHPGIKQVLHPHLCGFPQYALAKAQMKGTGGLFSILLNTDQEEACVRFSNALKRFKIAASWGGYESLQMPMVAFAAYAGAKFGPPLNLVRLYIGLEDPDFLVEDINQALDQLA